MEEARKKKNLLVHRPLLSHNTAQSTSVGRKSVKGNSDLGEGGNVAG